MQRRYQLERVANGDDELGAGPKLHDRLELFGRVEIADRTFGEEGRALALREKAVEIFAAHDVAQFSRLLPAKIVRQEIMWLLRGRETYLRVTAQIFRHRRRSAARRANNEPPARRFIQSG